MAISGVSGSGFTPQPVFGDMAVVLAARSSMAEMAGKAAVQMSAKVDDASAATASASATAGGSVDLYL